MADNSGEPTSNKAVYGLFDLLGLVLALPFGDALYHGEPITIRMWFFLALGLGCAVFGHMWPVVKAQIPRLRIIKSVDAVANSAWTWLLVVLVGFTYAFGPDVYQRAVSTHHELSAASSPNAISTPAATDRSSTATKLVLLFTGDTSVAPTEQDSSNVHWASWSALEGAMPFGSSDSGLGFELSLGREEYVNDITLIFLAFDKPINYDDFSLTMADGSPVPKWEHYETTSTIAILCIHGTVKANVALTIEPITITEAPVK